MRFFLFFALTFGLPFLLKKEDSPTNKADKTEARAAQNLDTAYVCKPVENQGFFVMNRNR